MTDSTVTHKSGIKPEHLTMEEWVESRIARFEGRKYDWNALKFQADYDPKYRRAQMRYIGTGATGVANDTNTVQADHFTFSTMVLPSKCEGPLHLHDDVEEVFFMLKGQITLMIQDGEHYTETVLRERDLISVPPGIYRGLFNHGEEEALMCVMLGTNKPEIPTHPSDHPLSKVKRNQGGTMTGFREQGSGIPLLLLHGISSGAASWHKQMALNGFRVLAWDMPGYGESPMLTVERASAGDYADALAAMLDRAGVWQAVLVGHSLGALVASAFAAKFPDRVRHLVLADAAQGYGQAAPEQREQVWRSREQQMALGGEILAQTRAAKLLRPGARGEDIATVASGMRKLRPEGYLAAAWMLAHDDIHGWLKRYSGTFEVWCGEQDAITQPELVQGLALRYGMPFTAIPQAGHASYLDNAAFFNQQLLRINEEVRDECTN